MNQPVSPDRKRPTSPAAGAAGDMAGPLDPPLPRFVGLVFIIDLGLGGWMALSRVFLLASTLFATPGPRDWLWLLLVLGLLADLMGLLLALAADLLGFLWRSRWAVRLGLAAAAIVLALRGIVIVSVFFDLAPPHDLERFLQGLVIALVALMQIYNLVWLSALWRFKQWLDAAEEVCDQSEGAEEKE